MYRDLGPGVSDGRDVRQLERNLNALGYDPGTVDDDGLGHDRRGPRLPGRSRPPDEPAIARSEVVISDGPARVGKHSAEVGDPARAGAPVTELTSTTPIVTAKLDAGLAADVHRGDAVQVTLTDGSEVGGKVTRVGTVATAGQDGESPTVDLRVATHQWPPADSTGAGEWSRSNGGARKDRSRCRSPPWCHGARTHASSWSDRAGW